MNKKSFTLCVVGLLVVFGSVSIVQADLIASYDLDGNANDSVGSFNGNVNGGATYVASPYGGGQAINLSSSGQYIDTVTSNATATNLGINGNNPKTISAWARPQSFNNGSIFDVGSTGAAGEMFSLRTLTSTDSWRAQYWSSPDFDFTTPNSANNWGWYAMTHDGTAGKVYYNGGLVGQKASTLNTNDGRPLEIGRYGGGTSFDGQIDAVNVYDHALTGAEIKAAYQATGGYIEDFEGPADTTQWYTSGGMNSTRLRDNRSANTGSVLSTFDNDANDPTGNVRNVYNIGQDSGTSMTWGPGMKVLDETGSLGFSIAGGQQPMNEGSQRDGGSGVALWDVAANDFVRDGGNIRFVTRAGNGGMQGQSISLAGLEGREILPVLYDRETGGWGWTEIDNISALPGVVEALDRTHEVKLEYGFDNAGDFMGWTGDTGSFAIGNSGSGLLARHINQKGVFTIDEGFLSSSPAGNWDAPTGEMISPEFTIDGDIIEFYIAGGGSTRPDLSFELWVDMLGDGNFSLERIAQHQDDSGDFDYEFWTIGDLNGLDAFLRLYDGNSGGWAHIEVDAIRMLDLAIAPAVPEPSTFIVWGLLGGLVFGLRRRRRK